MTFTLNTISLLLLDVSWVLLNSTEYNVPIIILCFTITARNTVSATQSEANKLTNNIDNSIGLSDVYTYMKNILDVSVKTWPS